MKISFPFQFITTNRFGKIYRPYATIYVLKKDLNVYIQRVLVVDSGADITIFPRKDAYLFGIDLEKETVKEKTHGIGGEEELYLYNKLDIKMGDIKLKIPVGFINRNDVPALLGRQHFLELFSVILEDHVTIIKK